MDAPKWFYVSAQERQGPVTDEQFAELQRTGVVQPETLVWCSGMKGWTRLREITNPSSPVTAGGASPESSSQGTIHSDGNRLSEAECLATDYPVEIIECLSKGWRTFVSNPWPLLGGAVLSMVILMALGMVPCLGILAQLALTGPLMGGVWLFFLFHMRSGKADFEQLFKPFGPRFVHCMMATLIPTVIQMAVVSCVLAVGWFAIFGGFTAAEFTRAKAPDIAAALSGLSIGMTLALFVVFCLVTILCWVLTILWMFAVPLAADKGYPFWQALELSRKRVMQHFWWHLLFLIVCIPISLLGMLACLVGIFISMAVIFASLAQWYERIFGRLKPYSGHGSAA